MESFWLIRNGLLHTYPSISGNLHADVVVVGAGITGALVSHALQQEGHRVIVVDRADVAFGSTAATTSMLQYEVDETLTDLTEMIGAAAADECYLAGVQAVDDIAHLVKKEKLACGFETKDSLLLAHNEKAEKDLKVEFARRKGLGLPVIWKSRTKIKSEFGLESFGGILSKKGASVDAYRLTHQLFHKNCQRKKNPLRVFDQSPISKIDEKAKSAEVVFENGAKITCRYVVYCNGFQATTMIKEKIADLFDTYACISEPLPQIRKALEKTLIWNTEEPYLYGRTTDDGRMLIGGEDSSFRMGLLRENIKAMKCRRLVKKFKTMAPGIDFIEDFTWAGTFGKTKDGLPYVGQPPEYKRSYFVLGYGGNGILFSVQAMKILPQLLKGEVSTLAHHYRFGR